MRTAFWMLSFVLVASPLAAAAEKTASKARPVVVTDVNFEREVERARELVLVEFWADWCSPCRMLAKVLESLAADYSGRVKICKVDVSDETVNPELARRFDPEPLPCMILFRKGREVDRRIGAGGNAEEARAKLRDWLDRNLAR